LRLNTTKYCIVDQSLYWKDLGGILLECIDEDEAAKVLTDMHVGVCGGQLYWKTTSYKILRAGYY